MADPIVVVDASTGTVAQRQPTAAEQADRTARDTTETQRQQTVATQTGNAATIRTKAQQALTANATFLALASPSTAQITAQVKALTRENNALIRLVLSLLDDVSDT